MTSDNIKQRILVIDDDPVLLKLANSVLEANGYESIIANEAPIGLEIAMTQSPDLIILDVMMPIINGYNICRLLKSEEKFKDIPIILLTSRSEDKDRDIGDEVGADGYIAKPFETNDLLDTIKKLLN